MISNYSLQRTYNILCIYYYLIAPFEEKVTISHLKTTEFKNCLGN